jgi:hypothetical protein
MRVVYDPSEQMYAVSHTTSFDDTGVFPPQMGMTALNTNGTVRWSKRFDAGRWLCAGSSGNNPQRIR